MTSSSNKPVDYGLLRVLGLSIDEEHDESEIQAARLELCSILRVPITTADEELVEMCRKANYIPRQKTGGEEAPRQKNKPAANADELAQIAARSTMTGLRTLKSRSDASNQTGAGMKALHNRDSEPGPAEGEQATSGNMKSQTTSQRVQSLRASVQDIQDNKPGGLLDKIKKLFSRG